jgi:transcription-repair coupling factor (superfamily II helicase)
LGAGFQIALHDLEIRGAGNLLGAEQSGQIGAVGFDLYVRLLADAVDGLKALAKGEPPPPSKIEAPIVIDLPMAAYIPESYIDDLNLRLSLYQRMAAATAPDAADDFERELRDRFGAPPASVRNLLFIVRARVLAKRAGIGSIAREERESREVLAIRASDSRDLRAQLATDGRRHLERADGVVIGHNQIRIDLEVAGDRWRDLLLDALQASAGAELVA